MTQVRARLLKRHEFEKYQALMEKYHYLGSCKTKLNRMLQYVIEDKKSGEFLALIDWGCASLKNASRDKWVGWSEELKNKRLKYVATNTRFLMLPWSREVKHLASKSLSLVLKRLSVDWAIYQGHHLFLAETFVDIAKFEGTCYKASNWLHVGQTKGYGRSSNSYYTHGKKKDVYLYPLHRKTKEVLSNNSFPHPFLLREDNEQGGYMVDVNKLALEGKGGLLDALKEIPDSRNKKGQRYKHHHLLALSVCAILSGANSFLAIWQYGELLSFDARKKLGFRPFKMPTEPVIRYTLNAIDPMLFDEITSKWIQQNIGKLKGKALAVDGKTMRAARTPEGNAPHILSAIVHDDGFVLTQKEVPDKTNEIPELKNLLEPLPLKGVTVTLDALHTQTKTAKYITEEKHGDYVMTVKENQKNLYEAIESLPEKAFSPSVQRD